MKKSPEMFLKIYALARKGFTDAEAAEILDVTPQSITNWKSDPKFFEAIKDAKKEADLLVEQSLYEKATGFYYTEDKAFMNDGQVTIVQVRKYHPQDTASMIFWLTNRQPEIYRHKKEVVNSGTQRVEVEFVDSKDKRNASPQGTSEGVQ